MSGLGLALGTLGGLPPSRPLPHAPGSNGRGGPPWAEAALKLLDKAAAKAARIEGGDKVKDKDGAEGGNGAEGGSAVEDGGRGDVGAGGETPAPKAPHPHAPRAEPVVLAAPPAAPALLDIQYEAPAAEDDIAALRRAALAVQEELRLEDLVASVARRAADDPQAEETEEPSRDGAVLAAYRRPEAETAVLDARA
ncbi:MAG: hypothetical protein VX640_03870 [Pseudomonadota bacterium]|nr:hypothetical protein [Pseudomonadota bacterium]